MFKRLAVIYLFLGAVRWPQMTALDSGPGRFIDVAIDVLCLAYLAYEHFKEED